MSGNQSAEDKRAFLSHGSADDRYVQEMVEFLRTLGFSEVFNDSHTIEPDEDVPAMGVGQEAAEQLQGR